MQKAPTIQRFRIEDNWENIAMALLEAYKIIVDGRTIPYEKNKYIWNACKSTAKWLTEGKKTGLLFYGNVGNGKTTMTRAICSLVNTLYFSASSDERKTIFMFSALELEKMIVDDPLRFQKLKKCPMLCIDDIGLEAQKIKSWGNELQPIPELIYYRYDNQLLTIASSNLCKEDLQVKYGERIGDRFAEIFDRIAFTHKSFRK